MEEAGKGKEIISRSKPTLMTVGKRTVISTGRWNDALMADYVIQEGTIRWIKIGELAGVGCARNTIDTKKLVRSRLSSLFKELRERNKFLAIRYTDQHKAASEVKIADLASEEEKKNVLVKLKSMKRRKEMSEEQYEKSLALLHKSIC